MKKSIKGLFVIGMTVQICLGLVWMCVNLFSVQNFGETAEYIEMSSSFVLDEYIGILYPALLFLLRTVFGGKVYAAILYLLQLAAAFFCTCAFCKMSGLGTKNFFSKRNVFGALYLTTIPFLMQLHLAVLPASLVSSLFVLLLGLCSKMYRKTENDYKKQFVTACILWLLMCLLMPDYIWLGVIPLVWIFGLGWKRKWKGKEKAALIAGMVVVLLTTVTVNSLTQEPGSRGKIQRTFSAAMVSRLAWPSLEANYYFWPAEVKTVMPQLKAREIDQYADNVKLIMGPLFETAFGKEQANKYYMQMALRCFSDRTKEILPRIGEDILSYLFTPFAVCYQLSGGGFSYSGWNFDRMWEQERALTGFYVKYSLYSFMVGLVILLIGLAARCVIGRKRVTLNGLIFLCVLCVLTQVAWYAMSGTYMMDYKNVPVVILLWYTIIVWGFNKLKECEE